MDDFFLWIYGIVASIFFLYSLKKVGALSQISILRDTSLKAVKTLRSKELNDLEKEKITQGLSKSLFLIGGKLLFFIALALFTVYVYLKIGIWLEIADQSSFIELFSSFYYFFLLLGLTSAYYFLVSEKNGYNQLDKLIHRMSFLSSELQFDLAKLENISFKSHRVQHTIITGLPRSGSTLLLEILDKLPSMKSHHYSDMPFILIPQIWQSFSRFFGERKRKTKPRWHQDGVGFSLDSPEALDEVLFRQLFQDSEYGFEFYDGRALSEAERNLIYCHYMKIIRARGGVENMNSEYLSKNNNHIFRLPILSREFPEAKIIIVFRNPVVQAASLLKQHLSFSKMQKEDKFSLAYMNAVGQNFFGLGMKSPGFLKADVKIRNWSQEIEFWLEYWVYVYENVLARSSQNENIKLVCYERLINETNAVSLALSKFLEVDFLSLNQVAKDKIFQKGEADQFLKNSPLIIKANDIYSKLLSKSF